MRYSDVFGSCHPAVNFLYFVLVIAFSMCLTHPVCLLLSVCGAVIYHAVLLGSRSLRKSAVWMVPMAVLAADAGEYALRPCLGGAAVGHAAVVHLLQRRHDLG